MQPEMFLYLLLGFVIGLGIMAVLALVFFLVRGICRRRGASADNIFPQTVPWKADEVITRTLPLDMLRNSDSGAEAQPADAAGRPAGSSEPTLRVIYETGYWESQEIIV